MDVRGEMIENGWLEPSCKGLGGQAKGFTHPRGINQTTVTEQLTERGNMDSGDKVV